MGCQNHRTLQLPGNCCGSLAEEKDSGYSEFDSLVLSIAEGWSNFDLVVLLPQWPNHL